jgi:histidine triad (HIT) family protein
MIKEYNQQNIFARIIRGELSSEKVYEDDVILIIKDKFPDKNWKTHLLAIPKGEFLHYSDFISNAKADLINIFFKTIDQVIKRHGLAHYQLVMNNGSKAGQEIMHFHVHIKSQDEFFLES